MNAFLSNDTEVHKLLLACYVPPGKVRRVHKNRPSYGIVFNCNPCTHFVFENGKRLDVPENAIAFLPKGSNYTVLDAENSGNSYAINFTLAHDIDTKPFVLTIKDTKAVLELFKKAEKAWSAKHSGYTLKCKSILYAILYEMQREYTMSYTNSSKTELIQPAIAYLHEHYTTESIKISQLAEMCHISPEYFRSIFQRIYGSSPIKYINRLKIQHAAELLTSGMYTVTEAATLSGYNDLSHFSREFKKIYGVKPTEY